MATKKLEVVITANAGNAVRTFKEFGDSADQLGGKVSAFSKVYSNELLLFGGAVVAGLGLAAKSAISFESAFAGVEKTVDGTAEQMSALKQGIMDMANEIPASREEIAAVAEAAGQLGIEIPNILEFTRTMIDLGESTNLSSEEAAMALAKLANVMQMPQTEFDRLGSTVVALGNNLATTEADIVNFGSRIAGAGKIAGLTEADVMSISAAFSSVGVEAESGGTAVQKVLLQMTEAVATGSEDVEKFGAITSAVGVDFATTWRNDPAKAFAAFVEGLGKQGDSAIQTLSDLGMTDQRLVRAFLSMAGAGDVLTDSLTIGTEAWAENSALAEEAGKRYETTEAKLNIFKNQVTGLATEVGGVILPALSSLAEMGGTLAKGFGEAPQPIQQVLVGMTGLVGVGSLALGTYGKLAPQIATLKDNLSQMGGMGQFAANNMGKLAAAGVGVGAALAVVAYWMGEAAKRDSLIAAGAQEYTEAIRSQTGSLRENIDAVTAKKFAEGALADALRGTDADIRVLASGIEANEEALDVWRRQVRSGASGVLGLQQRLRGAAESGDEFAAELLRLSDSMPIGDFIRLIQELEVVSTQYKEGKLGAEDYDAALEGLGLSADGAAPKVDEFGNVIEGAGAAASDAAADMDDLTSSIREFFDATTAVLSANIEFEAALDDMAASLAENQRNWDINTEAGRANTSQLIATKDAIIGASVAMLEQGASAEEATTAALGMRDSLVETMRAAGATKEEIGWMIATMGLTPENINTQINTNAPTVEGQIRNVNGQLEVARNGAWIPVEADTSQATTGLTNLWNNWSGRVLNIYARAFGGPGMADGGIIAAANGLLNAGIASPGMGIMWNEPETHGEAFIPLAPSKRSRSLDIWAETGRRLGVQGGAANVSAQGGDTYVTVHVDGSVLTSGEQLVDVIRDAAYQRQRSLVRPIFAGLA